MSRARLPITGGCLCGAIRYESTLPPDNGGICHCSICRKGGGGLHTVILTVPDSGFRFTKGQPKYYQSSEELRRGFCPECGSGLIGLYVGDPHVIIAIGTLDHPEDWPLEQEGWMGHVFVADKVPWEVISDGLPQLDQNRPGGNLDTARKHLGKSG